jgi:methionyl-tRNA formyltransferase
MEVGLVVTNPDRPSGRGMESKAPPVKQVALAAGLDVLQPDSARRPDVHERVASVDADVAVVVAYGKILPQSLLDIPRLGFVNLHFSLLPAYRGAAPVQRALMDGCKTTGVSIIVLTAGMDEGPVLAGKEVEIVADDTAGSLGERLAEIGAPLLVEALRGYAAGTLTPVEQDHAAATYAPKITTDEARISWEKEAHAIRNLVRGLNPAPGAWTTLRGSRLKVHRVTEHPDRAGLEPGRLDGRDGLFAGTGGAPVSLEEVQMEGKRRMSGSELARGLRLEPGERVE